MKEKAYESQPTLGVKVVLLAVCAVAGAIAAYGVISELWL